MTRRMPPAIRLTSARRGHQRANAVHRDRTRQSLEVQRARLVDVDQRLDGRVRALTQENLAARGLVAQARREIRDRTDRGVVEASGEPDGAHRRVALRDADAE